LLATWSQPPDHTLQTTALVNAANLRLASQEQPDVANRGWLYSELREAGHVAH